MQPPDWSMPIRCRRGRMSVMDPIPPPRPGTDYTRGDFFLLRPHTGLAAGPGAGRAERWLRCELGAATGHKLAPGDGSETDAIRISVHDTVTKDLGPEGYRLVVSPTGVHLYGGGPAGAFWGAQTLRQLLGPDAFRRAP